jgi:thymidylate synthase
MIEAGDVNSLFRATVSHVLKAGAPVAPRGLPTREVLGCQLRLGAPRRRVLAVPGRVINPAFAIANALWILLGSDGEWIYEYNDRLRAYTDEGVLRGAYGPRIRRWATIVDQLDRVRQLLLKDPDTRQAVVQVFDPVHDWDGARDVPCTIGYRFFIREGNLQLHTTMRSQDVWLGMPYDVFANTVLQELMAGWVGAELGVYVHTVDSLHLYECDLQAATRLADGDASVDAPSGQDPPISLAFEQLGSVLEAVRTSNTRMPNKGLSTWASVLASYRLWKRGQRNEARAQAPSEDTPAGAALTLWYEHLAGSSVSTAVSTTRDA